MAKQIGNRTDNQVRNRFNAIRKRMKDKFGVDLRKCDLSWLQRNLTAQNIKEKPCRKTPNDSLRVKTKYKQIKTANPQTYIKKRKIECDIQNESPSEEGYYSSYDSTPQIQNEFQVMDLEECEIQKKCEGFLNSHLQMQQNQQEEEKIPFQQIQNQNESYKAPSNENFMIEEEYYFKHLPRETCLEPEPFCFQEDYQIFQGPRMFNKKDTDQDIKKTKNIDWTYLNLNSEPKSKFGYNNQDTFKMEVQNTPSFGSFCDDYLNIDILNDDFKAEDFGGDAQDKNRDFAFGQF